MDWDEPVKKPGGVSLGEDLSTLGISELEGRVQALKAEIDRVEAEIKRKKEQQEAAASLFKN